MEKMFKRSILGAAVALAAVSGSANAAIDLNGEAVQLYGQAAGFMHFTNPDEGSGAAQAEIESRIGFRGRVAFDEFGPDFVWQIESGNANGADGSFGVRDTFLGFDFDGVGSFKYGRQLVAAYNYVDWPHTNPGLGNVFDWNNDIGAAFEDRSSNNFRFDSANFGGFNVQATLSGMGVTTDALVMSVAGSYTQDMFSVHAGYYDQKAYDETVANVITKKGDVNYSIVGGSVFLGDVTLTAAWKMMENNADDKNKLEQDAYSATAQYMLNSTYVFKLGYAATTDSKGAVKKADKDTAITGRLGYLLPSTYLYFDVRYYDMATENAAKTAIDKSKTTNFLVGAEYYF